MTRPGDEQPEGWTVDVPARESERVGDGERVYLHSGPNGDVWATARGFEVEADDVRGWS